ncbi:MAG: class I SAM-dependent methyltransferase [Candidatus Izimaplasma sp.]|nr:class I SAM-dependent methyltransferase [Candidatus Izimaplasma bacterium]
MIYQELSKVYDYFIDDDLYDTYLTLIQTYSNNKRVLDLGTGTGPLAIKLAKHNYSVTATDISQSMLEIASNKAVGEHVKIRFLLHDILDPIPDTYDIITMSSDVINYLTTTTEISTALNYISTAMTSESIFVFDCLKPSYLKELTGHKETIALDNTSFLWSVEKTKKPNRIEHKVQINNQTETHIQQTYPFKQYKKLLQDNNLTMMTKETTEERFIIVCQKQK